MLPLRALRVHSGLTLKKAGIIIRILIHVPFLSRRYQYPFESSVYICMWKVDYGCIDLIPPTPPLFNLFLKSGGVGTMSSQKGKKSRLPGTQKYLFFLTQCKGVIQQCIGPIQNIRHFLLESFVWEEAIHVPFLRREISFRGERW